MLNFYNKKANSPYMRIVKKGGEKIAQLFIRFHIQLNSNYQFLRLFIDDVIIELRISYKDLETLALINFFLSLFNFLA